MWQKNKVGVYIPDDRTIVDEFYLQLMAKRRSEDEERILDRQDRNEKCFIWLVTIINLITWIILIFAPIFFTIKTIMACPNSNIALTQCSLLSICGAFIFALFASFAHLVIVSVLGDLFGVNENTLCDKCCIRQPLRVFET